MRSDRPYRAALDPGAAIEQMRTLAGIQFCPRCVRALFEVLAAKTAPEAADRLESIETLGARTV